MKTIIMILMVSFSFQALAGKCHLTFSSRESGKLNRLGGYLEKHNASFEDCMNRAESLLGTTVRMDGTFVRGADDRKLTEGHYKYSDGRIFATGNFHLKH